MKIAIVLCVVLAVAMAAKPDRAARKQAKMQNKLNRQKEKERCAPTVTWNNCTNNQITQTVEPTTAEKCKSKFKTKMVNTFNCTVVQTKEKNGCTFTRTADLTPCGWAATFEASMTSPNCADRVPANKASKTMQCNRPFKMGANSKNGGGAGKNRRNKKGGSGGRKRTRGNKNKN